MTPEPAQTKADYRIKEVLLQEEGRGAARWQLDAEYGEIFEDQGRTTMKKVVVRVEEPARVWTVSADEGGPAGWRASSGCIDAILLMASSAVATAAPSRGRASGSLASIRATSASSAGRTSGRSSETRGAS